MKKLLLFSVLVFSAVAGFGQVSLWYEQATGFTPVSSGVKDVYVVDTNVVWITAYDGSGSSLPRQDYSMTTDGGNTWTVGTVPVGSSWEWAGMAAVNDTTAWAIFFNAALLQTGQVWHTTDGGATWTQQGAGQIYTNTLDAFPNNIYFWDVNEGVILGDQVNGFYEIYTTTDGGATWDSVPSANIPPPLSINENAWTSHFQVIGDTVWFDTNQGRVYRSIDRGHNWTVSTTPLPVALGDAIDLCFYSHLGGIARFYDDNTLSNSVVATSDGGATWSAIVPSGNLFGGDIQSVPGVDSMIISTGISSVSNYTGSSYSLDGGLNWVTMETGTQRGSLGIADSLTMWCGGFTASPTSGGIYKWITLDSIACGDSAVSAGTTVASDTAICFNDTVFFSSSGVNAPTVGDYSGVSWVISSADISGSSDPLNEPSFKTSYVITFPAPSVSSRIYINDGVFINGSINTPYGVYYWTPVVFGNATAGTPPTFLQDLQLDQACTFSGNSIAVMIYDPAICDITGIEEVKHTQLAVYPILRDETLDILLNSSVHGKAIIQITDITGRIVKNVETYVSKGSNHELVNVSNLAAGAYIIRAEVNGIVASNKLVKN